MASTSLRKRGKRRALDRVVTRLNFDDCVLKHHKNQQWVSPKVTRSVLRQESQYNSQVLQSQAYDLLRNSQVVNSHSYNMLKKESQYSCEVLQSQTHDVLEHSQVINSQTCRAVEEVWLSIPSTSNDLKLSDKGACLIAEGPPSLHNKSRENITNGKTREQNCVSPVLRSSKLKYLKNQHRHNVVMNARVSSLQVGHKLDVTSTLDLTQDGVADVTALLSLSDSVDRRTGEASSYDIVPQSPVIQRKKVSRRSVKNTVAPVSAGADEPRLLRSQIHKAKKSVKKFKNNIIGTVHGHTHESVFHASLGIAPTSPVIRSMKRLERSLKTLPGVGLPNHTEVSTECEKLTGSGLKLNHQLQTQDQKQHCTSDTSVEQSLTSGGSSSANNDVRCPSNEATSQDSPIIVPCTQIQKLPLCKKGKRAKYKVSEVSTKYQVMNIESQDLKDVTTIPNSHVGIHNKCSVKHNKRNVTHNPSSSAKTQSSMINVDHYIVVDDSQAVTISEKNEIQKTCGRDKNRQSRSPVLCSGKRRKVLHKNVNNNSVLKKFRESVVDLAEGTCEETSPVLPQSEASYNKRKSYRNDQAVLKSPVIFSRKQLRKRVHHNKIVPKSPSSVISIHRPSITNRRITNNQVSISSVLSVQNPQVSRQECLSRLHSNKTTPKFPIISTQQQPTKQFRNVKPISKSPLIKSCRKIQQKCCKLDKQVHAMNPPNENSITAPDTDNVAHDDRVLNSTEKIVPEHTCGVNSSGRETPQQPLSSSSQNPESVREMAERNTLTLHRANRNPNESKNKGEVNAVDNKQKQYFKLRSKCMNSSIMCVNPFILTPEIENDDLQKLTNEGNFKPPTVIEFNQGSLDKITLSPVLRCKKATTKKQTKNCLTAVSDLPSTCTSKTCDQNIFMAPQNKTTQSEVTPTREENKKITFRLAPAKRSLMPLEEIPGKCTKDQESGGEGQPVFNDGSFAVPASRLSQSFTGSQSADSSIIPKRTGNWQYCTNNISFGTQTQRDIDCTPTSRTDTDTWNISGGYDGNSNTFIENTVQSSPFRCRQMELTQIPQIESYSSQESVPKSPVTITTISDIPTSSGNVVSASSSCSELDDNKIHRSPIKPPSPVKDMDSAKKKKRFRKNGYAARLQKRLNRQKSMSRMFQHEITSGNLLTSDKGCLLRVKRVWEEYCRCLVQCIDVSGDIQQYFETGKFQEPTAALGIKDENKEDLCGNTNGVDSINLILDTNFIPSNKNIKENTIVKIYPPWQTLNVSKLNEKFLLNLVNIQVLQHDNTCQQVWKEEKKLVTLEHFFCPCIENKFSSDNCAFKLLRDGREFLEVLFPIPWVRSATSLHPNNKSQLQWVECGDHAGKTVAEVLANRAQGIKHNKVTICIVRVFCFKPTKNGCDKKCEEKDEQSEVKWSVLGRDSKGEFCMVELVARLGGSYPEDLLVGKVYTFSGFSVTKRIHRNKEHTLWSIINSHSSGHRGSSVDGGTNQLFVYVLAPSVDNWEFEQNDSLIFSWAIGWLKPQLTTLANILMDLKECRFVVISAIVRVVYASEQRLYLTDVSLVDNKPSDHRYVLVNVRPSCFVDSLLKKSRVVLIHDMQLYGGQLFVDKYSRMMPAVHSTFEDFAETYTKDLIVKIHDLQPTFVEIKYSATANDLVSVQGSVSQVDEKSAFQRLTCSSCHSDHLTEIEGRQELVMCATCNRATKPQVLLSLEVFLKCRSVPQGSLVKVKLLQESITRLLSPSSLRYGEVYNVGALFGQEVGPISGVVLAVGTMNGEIIFHIQEIQTH